MNFVKSRAWLCLAICFQAALLARGQDVITDSATSDKLAISPANPRLLKNSPLQFIDGYACGSADRQGWNHRSSGMLHESNRAQHGTVQVAVLGSQDLNVNDIDESSLRFHGARALSVSIGDVNQDGIPDLLLEFPLLDMHLSPHANRARLTGWLKNSQAFVGEDQITVALGMSLADANCH